MGILRFIAANWDSAAVLVLFAAGVTYIITKKRWDLLDKLLFGLVTWAEREYGNGTGLLKLAEVMQRLYPHIPFLIRVFLSTAQLEKLVNDALVSAKEKWDKNPKLIESAASPNAR
jgi:hypothetical protein